MPGGPLPERRGCRTPGGTTRVRVRLRAGRLLRENKSGCTEICRKWLPGEHN